MSRKIKFRYYDEQKKVMVYQKDQEIWSIQNEDDISYLIITKDGQLTHKTTKWMQASSCQTENGEIIFEGDIVKFNLAQMKIDNLVNSQVIHKTGKVVWHDEYGSFIIEWDWDKHQHHYELNCDSAFCSEVLGNEYENPDIELSQGNLWS